MNTQSDKFFEEDHEKVTNQWKKKVSGDSSPLLPSEDEIEETLQLINDILEKPEIDRLANAAVKEGYDLAAEILAEDIRDYDKADFARIKSVQGRAIAALAIDYLLGESTRQVLVGVPLKK